MNAHCANRVGVVVAALLLSATPASGQVARTHEADWPAGPITPAHHPLGTSTLALTPVGLSPRDTDPRPLTIPRERVDDAAFVTAILLSSMGSVAGLFAGAHAGVAMSNDSDGEFDDFYAAFVGSGIGTTLGAVLPAGLISDNWRGAVLGSMGGAVVGAMLGVSVGEKFNSSMGVAVYGLTHGLITIAATR